MPEDRLPEPACEDLQPDPAEQPARLPEGLVLVSTPVGNLGDMTSRGIAVLKAADLILCEDTRTTGRVIQHFGISTRLAPLHEHNEDSRIPGLLEMLRSGQRLALVSDAGTPLLSDPGYRLVRAVIAEGLAVGAVPGANAALLALTLSGLPPHPFLFLGFLPPRQAARRAELSRLRAVEMAGLHATLIWHEAPHRLSETLADLAEAFADRPACVARELTKRFEEVRRGSLPDLAAYYATNAARGEITLVVGPAGEQPVDDLDERLRVALEKNSLKDAASLVATATGLPRKLVYARALEMSR